MGPSGPVWWADMVRSRAGDASRRHGRQVATRCWHVATPPLRLIRRGLSEDQKRAHARALNLNRLHLTQIQRRELIAAQLKETPELSDRQIAVSLGVNHETIGAARRDLEGRGEIRHADARTDTKGRKQPATKPARPARTAYVSKADAEAAPATCGYAQSAVRGNCSRKWRRRARGRLQMAICVSARMPRSRALRLRKLRRSPGLGSRAINPRSGRHWRNVPTACAARLRCHFARLAFLRISLWPFGHSLFLRTTAPGCTSALALPFVRLFREIGFQLAPDH